MRALHAVLIMLASFLGPAPAAEPHAPQLVDRILVETEMPGENRLLTYESQEDMERVLTYLRRLEMLDRKPIDPDSFRAESYDITMEMFDGSKAVYSQLHRDYLRKNGGPWRGIIPADGLLFPPE